MKRYLLLDQISQGKFGLIYQAKDTQKNGKIVIVKISKDLEMNKKEFEVLSKLNKSRCRGSRSFAKVYAGGEFKIH